MNTTPLQKLICLVCFQLTHSFIHVSNTVNNVVPKMMISHNNVRNGLLLSSDGLVVQLSASPISNPDDDGNHQSFEDDDDEAASSSPSVVVDNYDFESGFQERLKKEGGKRGVQAKAVKRSVDSATNELVAGIKESAENSVGLLSGSEWNLTLGFLVLVVVLAIGTHFAAPPVLPFETSSNGEPLGFGVR
mmetsp:Transcript_8217/g.12847  ORF Transcript_8217/g.12847 Transcript_8217/m.12847 type:complete len:190 (+) Transcript_8217:241-810(+)